MLANDARVAAERGGMMMVATCSEGMGREARRSSPVFLASGVVDAQRPHGPFKRYLQGGGGNQSLLLQPNADITA